MSSLTATLLKKLIASSDADRKEIEQAVELHPTETEDQLITPLSAKQLHKSWRGTPERSPGV